MYYVTAHIIGKIQDEDEDEVAFKPYPLALLITHTLCLLDYLLIMGALFQGQYCVKPHPYCIVCMRNNVKLVSWEMMVSLVRVTDIVL